MSSDKGKYDIGVKYRKSKYELTLKEVYLDYICGSDCDISEDTFIKKINNIRGTGVKNHLLEKLDFDVDKIVKNSCLNKDEEEFAKLKLLKLLYIYEKTGKAARINERVDYLKHKIPITDILSNSITEYVKTDYSDENDYGNIVMTLKKQIESEISAEDNRKRKQIISQMYMDWQEITAELLLYVISNQALMESEKSYTRLENIYLILNETYNEMLRSDRDYTHSTEGVMKTFDNILWSHYILAFDNDKKFNVTELNENISSTYVENYHYMEMENIEISWDILEVIMLSLFTDDSKKLVKEFEKRNMVCTERELQVIAVLKYLITYGKVLQEEDKKYYRAAFKYCRTLIEWWYIYRRNGDLTEIEDGVRWDILVATVQEIVYVYQNDINAVMVYRNNKHPEKSMLSIIKKGDATSSIEKSIWINRVENRSAYNFGQFKHMEMKHKVEEIIFGFKRCIFSFFDSKDRKLAHELIISYVRSVIRNQEAVIPGSVDLEDIMRLRLEMFTINCRSK